MLQVAPAGPQTKVGLPRCLASREEAGSALGGTVGGAAVLWRGWVGIAGWNRLAGWGWWWVREQAETLPCHERRFRQAELAAAARGAIQAGR